SPAAADEAIKGRRPISLGGAMTDATIYERERLGIGAVIAGPAIVEQFDATTVVAPGWRGQVDGLRNLVLEPQACAGTLSPSRFSATRSRAWSRRCIITSIAPAIPPSSANRGISAA